MQPVYCYTSINCCYLPKARVLARTLKKVHPDWRFICVLADECGPEVDWNAEPFDAVMTLDDLGVAKDRGWIFRHNVVELCTAVKSIALRKLFDLGAEKVVFLDPDIAVFGSLDETVKRLDRHPVILTPHQIVPQEGLGNVLQHELYSMKYGVFNLGFLAVANRGQGVEFARFWRERLTTLCFDEVCNGMYTDQKWCDFVPVFFPETHVLRDPACNVSTWNLTRRLVEGSFETGFTVNGSPLKFYHYTSYDSGEGRAIISREHPDNAALVELWAWYDRQLADNGQEELGDVPWHYGTFDNGEPVSTEMRMAYRRMPGMLRRFPDPFRTGPGSFLEWWHKEGRVSRLAV
mgnify:CR=1 FL=1